MSEIQPMLKISEPPIDTQSIESIWEGDILNRRPCAEALTQIISTTSASLTIALNGCWGSGKTFLLKRWQAQLTHDGWTAIYFNAWEDDFIDDPLIAIIGQLWIALDCKENHDDCSEIQESILPFLKQNGCKMGLQVGMDVIRHHSGVDVEKLKENFSETGEYGVLKNYATLSKSRAALQRVLGRLINRLYEKNQKPLVFIVDELDRCRPTFAIETLERIKHLFNINHIVFVLGIDRAQLIPAIQTVYGLIDVENYLHRFIDLDLKISEVDRRAFASSLWKLHNIEAFFEAEPRNSYGSSISPLMMLEYFIQLSECHTMTLREIEQSMKHFSYLLIHPTPGGYHSLYAIILIFLKIKNRSLYDRYSKLQCSPAEVSDYVFPEAFDGMKGREFLENDLYLPFIIHDGLSEESEKVKAIFDSMEKQTPIISLPSVSRYLKKKPLPKTVLDHRGERIYAASKYRESFLATAKNLEMLYRNRLNPYTLLN